MEQDIIQQNQKLSALNQIGHTVNQTLELNTVLNTSLDKILEVMNCESGGIYIREAKESEYLVLRVTKGLSPGFLKKFQKIRIGAGLMGKGLANHQAVILESVTKKTKLTDYMAPEGIKLAVSVPITVKDRLIGAFNVGSYVSDTFEPWKVELLLTIGNHIGVVIENAILMDSLKNHERDLQVLSSQIIEAQEEERKRISRELHDEASQALVAAKINLEMFEKRLPSQLEAVRSGLLETSTLLVRTLENLRRLSHDLRPAMLDDLGLEDTLNEEVDNWCQRQPDTVCDLSVSGDLAGLDDDISITLYRIVQECLTNVSKHALAHNVSVRLDVSRIGDTSESGGKAASCVKLVVQDDGVGMETEKRATGLGLIGMRERVESLNGCFSIDTSIGNGTTITVDLPLTSDESGGCK